MEQYLNDDRILNEWAIIKLSDLPDNYPVLGVSKSLHSFIRSNGKEPPKVVLLINQTT